MPVPLTEVPSYNVLTPPALTTILLPAVVFMLAVKASATCGPPLTGPGTPVAKLPALTLSPAL